MVERYEYRLILPLSSAVVHIQHPPGGVLRNPRIEEVEALAELMLDAYRGTIDYEGEGADEALEEINGWFGNAPNLDASWVYAGGDIILSASLVSGKESPILSYIITRSIWKGRGLGAYVVRQSLLSLQDAGVHGVRAWVTEGNTPSERILARFGFQRAEE